LVQALGPDLGYETAKDLGILEPSKKASAPEHLRSRATDLIIKADLKGVMPFRDWEVIQNATVYKSEEPPEDIWGKELLAWILLVYKKELSSALEICLAEIEEDVELALANFEINYVNSLKRASTRAFVAGKQDDTESLAVALAIAALAFTVMELATIEEVVKQDRDYFQGFIEKLRELGSEYGRAGWRTDLYSQIPLKIYNMGVIASMDPEVDLVNIAYGGSENPCEVCPTRWGTYTFETYNKMGGPPANWCLGFNNCHCVVKIKRGARMD